VSDHILLSQSILNTNLKIMKYSIIFILLALIISSSSIAQPNYPNKPEEAKLISIDLKNFINAYNELQINSDTTEVLKTKYFDLATPGLKEYINRFDLTPNALKKAIKNNPEVYARIDHFYSKISQTEQEYIGELKEYQNILQNAVFPPTYLLVADYKGIAQASKFGQLVSVEKKCIDDPEVLKHAIIHELTHFQQVMNMGFEKYTKTYTKKGNMLDLILREGAADFITYYLVRKNESDFIKLKNYEKDEIALWKRFQKDLENQEKDFWLIVSFKDNNKGNPIQLGYALGYKIVKSYYINADDKSKALAEILKMENPEQLMLLSNYKPK
jgi:uncharacterized protein YjaZ